MPQTSSSPKAIRDSVESLLCQAGIPRIGSVGWSTAYDPDPELVGHAMWQNDGPKLDIEALQGDRQVLRRPKDSEKLVASLGEDFCGLMDVSRLSIGFALLWLQSTLEDQFELEDFFWSHHCDAYLKLAIASDRLRDLLIVACTGASPRLFRQSSRRKRRFTTPFKDAGRLLANRKLVGEQFSKPLKALATAGDTIYEYVRRRNEIVHDLATEMARFTRDAYSKLAEQYDHEIDEVFSPPQTNIDHLIGGTKEVWKPEQKMSDALEGLKEWYALLIKSSHHVFEIEYWSRILSLSRSTTT